MLKNCIFINITNSPAVMLDIVFVRLKCITNILHVYFVKSEMQTFYKSHKMNNICILYEICFISEVYPLYSIYVHFMIIHHIDGVRTDTKSNSIFNKSIITMTFTLVNI